MPCAHIISGRATACLYSTREVAMNNSAKSFTSAKVPCHYFVRQVSFALLAYYCSVTEPLSSSFTPISNWPGWAHVSLWWSTQLSSSPVAEGGFSLHRLITTQKKVVYAMCQGPTQLAASVPGLTKACMTTAFNACGQSTHAQKLMWLWRECT